MPRAKERKRGGVLRYRTLHLGRGKYVHIAVVRKAGPRGGHTLIGPVRRVKAETMATHSKAHAKRHNRRMRNARRSKERDIFYAPGEFR